MCVFLPERPVMGNFRGGRMKGEKELLERRSMIDFSAINLWNFSVPSSPGDF